MERRLTAILAADVVGYSRLMGANETGTLAALKALQTDFIDGKIAEHQGRTVKLTGDGMLVEFPSVVSAVACAADVQRGMRDRNAGVPQERRIEFRIGVNVGDIIVEGKDIFWRWCQRSGTVREHCEAGRHYDLRFRARSRGQPPGPRLRGFGRANFEEHRETGSSLQRRPRSGRSRSRGRRASTAGTTQQGKAVNRRPAVQQYERRS